MHAPVTTSAEATGAKKKAVPDIEMSESGSDSAVATYWGSQARASPHKTHMYTHAHTHTRCMHTLFLGG